jgi:DeoR/GlpR family transcriptional regulator of sugar metabolism
MNTVNGRERQLAIAELVGRDGRVQVRPLAQWLACSEMTVRRDLEALEATGVLRRVHGGAVRLILGAEETPFELRALQRVAAKQAIATVVARLLADGETVVLDGGTTALEIARAIRDRQLTVMPLAVRTLAGLLDRDGIRLLVPGGEVRAGEQSFVGSLAEAAFEQLRFDTCVLSSCGIDSRQGVTENLLSEAAVKRTAANAAQRVIVAVDASKLGTVAFGHICAVTDVDIVVTDSEASAHVVQELRDADVDVRIAGQGP